MLQKINYRYFRRLLFLLLLCTVRVSFLFSQESNSVNYTTLLFPKSVSPKRLSLSAGVALSILPRRIVEEEIRQIPTVNLNAQLGLPFGLTLRCNANFVYIVNQVSLGLAWSHSWKHFSFGVHEYASVWVGSANFQGFDTYGIGVLHYPGVSIGGNFDDVFITFEVEALVQISQKTVFGSDNVQRYRPNIAGARYTIAVEQNLFDDNRILWGVHLNYAEPQYQMWLAFSDTKLKILSPEFFVGYIF